jgi:hypothetical protein
MLILLIFMLILAWPSIPFFIFAGVSVGGSLVVFLMDETTGRPLDDIPIADNDKSCKNTVVGHTNKCFEMEQNDDDEDSNDNDSINKSISKPKDIDVNVDLNVNANPNGNSVYSKAILIPYSISNNKADLKSHNNEDYQQHYISPSTPVLVSISKITEDGGDDNNASSANNKISPYG